MTDQDDNKNQPFPSGDATYISSTAGTRRTFLPGDIVDNTYQLTSPLGHGGMGVVYACKHLMMNMDYALKLLNGDQLSEEYWSRFQTEAQALAKLNHQGIVRVHNMGIDAGQYPYYVMDLLSGETLDVLLRKNGPLDRDLALDLFIQVADALSSAHQQGIVHRDIKPSNLMLIRNSQNQITSIKIVDFGIARLSKHGFAAQSQTATGLVFGTPYYMSPEQCQGLRVDQRSDIYSLGCTLFETLTGRPPHCGDNAFHTFMLHQTGNHPSLGSVAPQKSFPESVENAVDKMLAKEVADRYQTMAQVKQDLERIRAGKPILTQGLSTIPPGQNLMAPEITRRISMQERRENRIEGPIEEHAERESSLTPTKIGAIVAVTLIVAGAATYGLHFLNSKPKTDVPSASQKVIDTQESSIISTLLDSNLTDFNDRAERLKPMVLAYRNNPVTASAPFKTTGARQGFQFPDKFIIGQIRFGDGIPLMATGFVPLRPGKTVCMYLTNFTEDWPGVLDKFGPDDLDDLEVKMKDPPAVIERVSHWHKLTELCFFNSLVKALPGHEASYDESALKSEHLKLIDKLDRLRSLGLCGWEVDGAAVAKMHLLNKLHVLKVKRISNLPALINVLPQKDNITELWLGGQDLTDKELKQLALMKNLQVLRIRRSSLDPSSWSWFKQMPALRRLTLDAAWTDEQKLKFADAVPFVEWEPVTDYKYWKMFPNQG